MYIVAGCKYLRLNGIRKSICPYITRKFCGLLTGIFKGKIHLCFARSCVKLASNLKLKKIRRH